MMPPKREFTLSNFDWCYNLSYTEYSVWVPSRNGKAILVLRNERNPTLFDFEKPTPLDPNKFPDNRNGVRSIDKVGYFESANYILNKLTELKLDAYIEYCRRRSREEDKMLAITGNLFSPNSGTSGYSTGNEKSPRKDELFLQNSLELRSRKKGLCKFCFKNGEIQRIYESHNTKDEEGNVICPILMKYVCQFCGATGSKAHTRKYCPKNSTVNFKLPMLRLLANGNYSSSHHHK